MLAVVALAIVLRAADPLSNPVMAAEDPYAHMALVREHLRDGRLDPALGAAELYPPGLHAVLAVLWVYGGGDLYDLMRFAPVALGAVSILGVGVLLGRWHGPVAAVAGALALALMPEHIFRSGLAAPTALDLALLPFLFGALLEVARGRFEGLAAAVPIALLMVVAHPWALLLLALGAGVFALLVLVCPWTPRLGGLPTLRGSAGAAAVVVGALGLAMLATWPSTIGPG
ncbi:MAG TPA: hypothetical protein VGR28_00915, partial [Candidatus Thermoplasmatota archaeon]|nr:hypothetical protein [Candidatus Thermoplasmatota archaeon]